ncbi:hypothetical protein GCM10027347_61290 [Larkinella harenae]
MKDNSNIQKKPGKSRSREYGRCTINFEDLASFNMKRIGLETVIVFQKLQHECYTKTIEGKSPDGWYFCSKKEFERYGIKEDRFDRAVRTLEKIGVLVKSIRPIGRRLASGYPERKTHYRILFDVLDQPDVLESLYAVPDEEIHRLADFFKRRSIEVSAKLSKTVEGMTSDEDLDTPF